MRRFAVYAIALSLARVVVPTATADSAGVAVCGDYGYGDDDSEVQSAVISLSDGWSASCA